MEELLDIEQACECLKLAKPTVYKFVRNGEIPAFKVGRIWRFQKSSLESWIQQRIQENTIARTKKAHND